MICWTLTAPHGGSHYSWGGIGGWVWVIVGNKGESEFEGLGGWMYKCLSTVLFEFLKATFNFSLLTTEKIYYSFLSLGII